MAEPFDSTTLWTKTENAAGIINPEIGPVGVITGIPTYDTVKFNNGVKAVLGTDKVLYNRAVIYPNPNVYIYDFWIRYQIASGPWSVGMWIMGDRKWGGADGFLFGLAANEHWRVYRRRNGGVDQLIIDHAGETWTQDQVDHIALVVDNTASFDGAKTCALYRNKIQIASNATGFAITNPNTVVSFLSNHGSEACRTAWIDNLKVVTGGGVALLNSVLDNSENEAWPPTGGFKMLNGGIKSPMMESSLLN